MNSIHYLCKPWYMHTLICSSCEKKSTIQYTVKPVLSGHSKRRPKIGFQDRLLLNVGQKYCRMLQESILQYFQPSLSYHLSLRTLFSLCLSGRLRQILLYLKQSFSDKHLLNEVLLPCLPSRLERQSTCHVLCLSMMYLRNEFNF